MSAGQTGSVKPDIRSLGRVSAELVEVAFAATRRILLKEAAPRAKVSSELSARRGPPRREACCCLLLGSVVTTAAA